MTEVIYDESKVSSQSTVKTDDGKTVRANNVVVVSGAKPSAVEEMPVASLNNKGKIVQYVGETTAEYTQAYFYICTEYVAVDSSISISQYEGAGVTPSVDKATFETQIMASGTYDFSYDGEKWYLDGEEVDLADYGITYTESEEATATFVGTGITDASVVLATFKTQIEATGNYSFIYDGSDWKLGDAVVDLADYGISYTAVSASASASQTVGSDLGTVSVNVTTFASQVTTSGTYNFVYDGSDWKLGETVVDLTAYGISYTGASVPSSATISQTAGTSLTDVAVNVSTFESQISTAGSYVFTSDGTDWSYDGNVVDLTDYGITYTGTPVADDALTVVYTEAVVVPAVDDEIEVGYIAEGPYADDTITVAYEKGLEAGEVLRVEYVGYVYGYEWLQINVQPGGGSTNSIEITSSHFPAASQELLGKIYAYTGDFELSDDIVFGGAYEKGCLYQCIEGTTPSAVSTVVSGSGISYANVFNEQKFLSATGLTDGQSAVFTYIDDGSFAWDPLSGEADGLIWSIDANTFTTALHTNFPNVDFSQLDNVEINYNGVEYGIILWTQGWSEQLASANNITPADYGITVDNSGYSGGGWTTFNTYKKSAAYWDYNGSHLTRDDLWETYGISVDGDPINNDSITATYTAPSVGYVWEKLNDKYYKLPELAARPSAWGSEKVVEYLGMDEQGYQQDKFYRVVETNHDAEVTVSQTTGSDLSDISVNRETFGNKIGWLDHDENVVFKFVETTQTTGNVTYHLTNIQATIDLDAFYSALKEVTTVDMANMYKPEYSSDGWQIAVKDQYDDWSVIAQNIDPAQWGITITSGTPAPYQDNIEVYFTAFGGDQWGVYVDETLQETGLVSDWGISYSGTPVVGDEITGVYKTWYTSYGWEAASVVDYRPTSQTLTLQQLVWDNNEQTLDVITNVDDRVVIVSPTPSSMDDYIAAGIKCTAQEGYRLTFSCTTVPQTDISVNIVIM